jgi:hypothetical protein
MFARANARRRGAALIKRYNSHGRDLCLHVHTHSCVYKNCNRPKRKCSSTFQPSALSRRPRLVRMSTRKGSMKLQLFRLRYDLDNGKELAISPHELHFFPVYTHSIPQE